MSDNENYRFHTQHDARLAGLATTASRRRLSRQERRDLVERLSSFDRFAGASARDLAILAESSRAFTYPANWVVVHARTTVDHCLFVTSGTLRVFTADSLDLGTLTAGDVVGANELYADHLATTSVVTVTRVAGIGIPREVLRRFTPSADRTRAISPVLVAQPQCF